MQAAKQGKPAGSVKAECTFCGTRFIKNQSVHRFCSSSCCDKSKRLSEKGLPAKKGAKVSCLFCGVQFRYKVDGGTKHCSSQCAIKQGSQTGNRKRRARLRNAPSEVYYNADIIRRDGENCSHCEIKTERGDDRNSNDYMTFDHIIPLAKGGHDCEYNIQILCRSCNTKKGDKIYSHDMLKAERLKPEGVVVEVKKKDRRPFEKKASTRSSTGVNGVHYSEYRGKWMAQLEINGKRTRKQFNSKAEAVKCRSEMEKGMINANA